MADFKIAYQKTMGNEGGWSDDPDDSGGQTWRGITRNNFPHWDGWTIIDSIKMGKTEKVFEPLLFTSPLLQIKVLEFYKKEFWDVIKLDKVANQDIANELFDTGVNMHHTVAAEFLQKALNATNHNGKDYPDIDEDGQIGSQTLIVLSLHPRPEQILKLLNCQQGVRYMEICRKKPSQEKFMTSWLSRVGI